ncbi:hypothetical protein CPB83DRAFT_860054 [Crepidotus variabilis]|uniref:Uncharacterized protein n=1 Tax=Crepidotus variabilis TaxID=179855 RepID=A0A9P6E9U0_9AGAR|nr:hypothetical protein CPB83DRAFT_860054 [Crepidotus variabilis]
MPADREESSPKKFRSQPLNTRPILLRSVNQSPRIRQNLDAQAPPPEHNPNPFEGIEDVVQGQRRHKSDLALCPPVMVNQLFLDDPYNKCVYVGSGAGEDVGLKRDLWRLDLETLTWDKLTVR